MAHSTTHAHRPDPLRPASVGGPEEAPSHPHQQGPSLMFYFWVFVTLIVLLFATVAAAFIPHQGGFFNVGIALAIAAIKATLVILFFMHVVDANRLTKLFVAGTFIWLVVMFAFTFTDYMSREWTQMSRGWVENPTVPRSHLAGVAEEAAKVNPPSTAPATAPSPAER
jgi:cytochrome c oxidase subunit IV